MGKKLDQQLEKQVDEQPVQNLDSSVTKWIGQLELEEEFSVPLKAGLVQMGVESIQDLPVLSESDFTQMGLPAIPVKKIMEAVGQLRADGQSGDVADNV